MPPRDPRVQHKQDPAQRLAIPEPLAARIPKPPRRGRQKRLQQPPQPVRHIPRPRTSHRHPLQLDNGYRRLRRPRTGPFILIRVLRRATARHGLTLPASAVVRSGRAGLASTIPASPSLVPLITCLTVTHSPCGSSTISPASGPRSSGTTMTDVWFSSTTMKRNRGTGRESVAAWSAHGCAATRPRLADVGRVSRR